MSNTINIDDPFVLSRTGEEIDKVTRLPYEPVSLTDAEKAQMQANIGTPAIEMDETPSPYSTNPVTSRGIYEWVREQIAAARTLDHIVVKHAPNKTAYEVGENLDLTGIAVAAFFTDGFEDNVTDDCTFAPADGTLLTAIGEVTITATYTRGTITRTATTTITVWDASQHLTFWSDSAFSLQTANGQKNWVGTIEYSTNARTWSTWDGVSVLDAVEHDGIYALLLRGTGNTVISGGDGKGFTLTGTGVTCDGDIMTLLDYQSPDTATMAASCFAYMFKDCSALIKAPDLTAPKAKTRCYQYMYSGCTSLVEPSAMATIIDRNYSTYDYCFSGMYFGCTALTKLIELPSAYLDNHCYQNMFNGCTSLDMRAGRTGVYQNAFRLPTTGTGVLVGDATLNMFANIRSSGAWGTPAVNTTYYAENEIIPALV